MPALEISTPYLVVDEDMGFLTVSNKGNILINWAINSADQELSISPYTGLLHPGESIQVSVKVFKDQLEEGIYQMTASLTTDTEIFYHIGIQVPVFEEEERWDLDNQLVDAEFDRVNNRIVAVTDESTLLLIDPFIQQVRQIKLGFPATCVSVSLDGKTATVGHSAALSRVDLTLEKVVAEQGLPIEVYDLVEGLDGWVYINPKQDLTRSIYNFNWSNGEQGWSEYSSTYANSILKVSPDGKYLFSLPTNVIPADVVKLNIGSGRASYVYDSPYHGDYSFGENIWVSADSERLFSESGNVFVLSENSTIDLTYFGKLPTAGRPSAVSQLVSSKKIAAVYQAASSYTARGKSFFVLYSSALELLYTSDLPSYFYKDSQGMYQIAETEIRYGFPSSDDKKYVVVSRSELSRVGQQKYSIQVLDII